MIFGTLFIIIAVLIGLFMTWGVGANDLANIMSTTMASKSITIWQAMIIAIIFEFAGALLGGAHVTNTIRSGIIDTSLFGNNPQILVDGMLAVLLASMTWMLFASYLGMPVSITNAIVGAIVGFGVIVLGVHAVHWETVRFIALSWVCSPIIAGLMAFLLFLIIKHTILMTADPCRNAQIFIPFLFFLVGIVLSIMVVIKDLTDMGIALTVFQQTGIIMVIAFIIAVFGFWLSRRTYIHEKPRMSQRFDYIEKLFGVLMGFTACAMVFAHGSNDVAIAVGPVSAIYSIIRHHDLVLQRAAPAWIIVLGCVGVVLGLMMYGRKVIATVGHGITSLTPSRAFAATIAAASTVIVSTSAGIPVSATQTLVGGVLGVGLARGIGALNLRVIRNIILSWVVTVPVTAILAIIYFDIIKLLLKM